MKNLRKGLAHLRRDPVLDAQIDKFGVQLSNMAADTIYSRVTKITKIDPSSLLVVDPAQLRAAGTSWAKIRSLNDLSRKVLDKSLQLAKLDQMSDEEVISHLTQVKGIGPWTIVASKTRLSIFTTSKTTKN